jgi:hypothetical protein
MALISFLLNGMASPTIGRFDGQSLCAGDEGDEQQKKPVGVFPVNESDEF